MQKKPKILITAITGIILAFAANHISNNGGLQSSILAPLQSCKTGAITSIERCRDPLTTEKNRIQKEIDTLNQKITAKKTECTNLDKMKNKANQAKTCRKQLTELEKDKTTKTPQLNAINIALSKLVSETPLQIERTKLQKEIETLKTQITAKTTECATFKVQKKTTQTAICHTQLTTLKQSQFTKEKALATNEIALKKIAGISALTSNTSNLSVKLPSLTPTPQSVANSPQTPLTPVFNAAPAQPSPPQSISSTSTTPNTSPASLQNQSNPPTAPTVAVAPSIPTINTLSTPRSAPSAAPTITLLSQPRAPASTTLVTIAAPPVAPSPAVTPVLQNSTPTSTTNPGVTITQQTTPVPTTTVAPTPVTTTTSTSTPTPTPSNTTQPSSSLIINDRYPVTAPFSPKCADPKAANIWSSLPCLYDWPPPECMAPWMLANDGSCRYPQNWCKIPWSHNYDENNDTVGDPSLCLTCFDGIQNGDEEKMDCGGSSGKCQACMMWCTDPNASNHNAAAVIDNGTCIYGMRDNYSRPPREICNDPFADNFEEVDYSNPSVDPFFKPDTVNNDVCTYCDLPKKINEIKNKEGAKVKSSLNKLKQEGKEQCKKEICESGSTAYSNQCTIATEFKEQYAYLQMYLYLSDEDPGTLDGIYRGSKEITSTPTAGSNTRKALVQFGSNPANLAKIKGNQCQFMSTLLQKELIKDYEPESEERIKVTQMALAMDDINPYKGSIDGDQIKTYNLLQKKYGWSNEKFGVSYIAGPDMNWQVGRATQFHEDGTPFMRRPSWVPSIAASSTNLGASLPLPVTVKLLCPNILSEIDAILALPDNKSYVNKLSERYNSNGEVSMTREDVSRDWIQKCKKLKALSDPFAQASTWPLYECIIFVNEAKKTTCQDRHHEATVKVRSIGNEITVPLVDIGPNVSVWSGQKEATIDLTYGAMKAISGGNLVGTNYETCFQLIPGKTASLPAPSMNT